MKPDRSQLRLVRMFNGLPDADLDALLASLRFRTVEVPEVVWSQGDPGDFLVVVCHGRLGVYARDGAGPEVQLGESGAGEVLGEMSCIDPAPRTATVSALESTLVGVLSRDALHMLRQFAPNVYATVMTGVINDVTRRLREIDSKLEEAQGGAPSETPPPSLIPKSTAEPTSAPSKERSGIWQMVARWRGGR